jgi:hypothetical protein
MMDFDLYTLTVILGLACVTVLARGFFLISSVAGQRLAGAGGQPGAVAHDLGAARAQRLARDGVLAGAGRLDRVRPGRAAEPAGLAPGVQAPGRAAAAGGGIQQLFHAAVWRGDRRHDDGQCRQYRSARGPRPVVLASAGQPAVRGGAARCLAAAPARSSGGPGGPGLAQPGGVGAGPGGAGGRDWRRTRTWHR